MVQKALGVIIIFCMMPFFSNQLHAQELTDYLFISSFENEEELQVLQTKADDIFEYIQTPEAGAFVGTVTAEQKKELEMKGFEIQVIEKSPDLSQYKMVYSAGEFQGYQLAYLGEIYQITAHDFLLKVAPGTSLEPDGTLEEFSMLPLEKKEISTATSGEDIKRSAPEGTKRPAYLNYGIAAATGILILLSVLGVLLLKKRMSTKEIDR